MSTNKFCPKPGTFYRVNKRQTLRVGLLSSNSSTLVSFDYENCYPFIVSIMKYSKNSQISLDASDSNFFLVSDGEILSFCRNNRSSTISLIDSTEKGIILSPINGIAYITFLKEVPGNLDVRSYNNS